MEQIIAKVVRRSAELGQVTSSELSYNEPTGKGKGISAIGVNLDQLNEPKPKKPI